MKLLILLVVLFSTSCVLSRSNGQHLRDDEEIFEDALLERLHNLRNDEDDFGSYMYDDENEPDDSSFPREDLVHVINEIKREVDHSSYRSSKKSIESHGEILHEEKKDTHKAQKREKTDNKRNLALEKREPDNRIRIIEEYKSGSEKRESQSDVNNQVASVVPDDSLEKQNEIDKEVNLRDVLEEPVTTAPNTTKKAPSHGFVKQTITSTRVDKMGLDKVSFIAVVAGCCVAAIAGIVLAAYCWYKLRSESNKEEVEEQKEKLKKNVEKKNSHQKKPLSDDEKMVKNAEIYHYQHAKNQHQQLGQNSTDGHQYQSGETTDEDDDDNTVYECPGPASAIDMKVVNPMFSDSESIHHSDKQSESNSQNGTPTPPNERIDQLTTHEQSPKNP